MPWLNEVEAVVETYYGGQAQGAALARVLWGDVNPSGKLTMTYPTSEDALPPAIESPYGTRRRRGRGLRRGRQRRLQGLRGRWHHPAVPLRPRAVLQQLQVRQPESPRQQPGERRPSTCTSRSPTPGGGTATKSHRSTSVSRQSTRRAEAAGRLQPGQHEGRQVDDGGRHDRPAGGHASARVLRHRPATAGRSRQGPTRFRVGPSSRRTPLRATFTVK